MITTSKVTPFVLLQSASGDILVKEPDIDKALDAFIRAGGRPGYRAYILAADKTAHADTNGRLVYAQRGPIWEVRIIPGPKIDYVREVRP